ncbi:MAG TPA: hypothetical protein VJS64_10220 [Pyrinomonadaceae bacterium]|nr:hypothetical protein [Pyrinomonadaceae bacterium]
MKELTLLPNSQSFPEQQTKITNELLDQLLDEIESQKIRTMVSAAFSALLSLLQDVPELAKQRDDGDDPDAVIERFQREANSLIDYIGGLVSSAEGLNEELAETLDGIAFALSHDLKRTLGSDLKELGWKSDDDFARGKVAYVCGLLTNCLQQSIITLAQVFDPALDGGKLFDNYQARLRESLLLCRDLTDMVLHAHACEKDLARNFPKLLASVNGFRGEAMHFLMYKDWQEFEGISDKLLQEDPEAPGVGPQVHSFICYLETLLGQVKLRSVLVEVFCDLLPEQVASGSEWSEAQHRLAFELYRAELTSTLERNA